jgi:integrase
VIKKVARADAMVFQVYGRRDGKKVYVGTYPSRREALAADEEHRVTVRKIEAGELPSDLDTKRTFGTALKQWLKKLDEDGSRSSTEYAGRAELYLLPAFRDMPLIEIHRADVIRWRDELGQKVTASTVNTVLGTLSSAFAFFIDRDWAEHNPCHQVKRLKPDPRVFPWLESTEAITRLLSHCTPNIRNLIAFLVGTGCRLDEALHLRWDDVDLEHRLVTVHRGRARVANGKERQGTTKSGKARRVPVFDSVLGVLKAMKLARGAQALLWPGANPGKPLGQASVRKPFKAAIGRAGLPKELRLHDLRHTFASLFLIDGGDIFKLSRILGHHSVAITERTYAHLKPDAFEGDYGRVAFRMPSEARVVTLSAR